MKEYRFTDKTLWPRGEWDNEPDKVQWVDPSTDLDCLAVRNGLGAWCGYVGVPESHPAFGKDYDQVEANCHGGLTFASTCQEHGGEHGICHVPEDGRADRVWWLGFDCAHSFDMTPECARTGGEYRNLAYVTHEVTKLAAQLKEMV